MMDVIVKLFGAEADAAGEPSVVVEVVGGSDCAAVRRALAAACPSLEPLLSHARFAVSNSYAPDDPALVPPDEVPLSRLVSGG